MRSIQVNIDKPNFTINPTNCSPFSVDSQGIGDQGTRDRLLSSYFHAVNCASAAVQAEDDDSPAGRPQGAPRRARTRRCSFDLRTRPGDANIKSLSVTLLERLRDRPAPSRQHLLARESWPRTRAPGGSRSARRRRDAAARRSRSPAPSTRSRASAACRHVAFILNGQVDLVPRAESTLGQGRPPEDDGPGRPRRADRPLPPRPSSAARPATWSTPAASAARRPR